MATEIALATIKADQDLTRADSAASQKLQTIFDTLVLQPGMQRFYWGMEIEHPRQFRLFVDWDSVEAHQTFMNTDIYPGFVDLFGEICHLDSFQVYHAHLTPFPPRVLGNSFAPATELLNVSFPADYADADRQTFAADMHTLLEALEKGAGPEKLMGTSAGWTVELVNVAGAEVEHGEQPPKGLCFVIFLGWRSVQDHLDFRETDAFKEVIGLLRNAKGKLGMRVVHYSGTEVQGKGKSK